MSTEFINNSDIVLSEFHRRIKNALEACGELAEGYAIDLCPTDTGRLKNSITHTVKDSEVIIGSNVEYAPYVELGTGSYYPGGRDTPWAFKDSKGNWHMIMGTKPQPYLKPAITNHIAAYERAIKMFMQNG